MERGAKLGAKYRLRWALEYRCEEDGVTEP